MEKISRILGVSVAALLAEDGAPEPRIERPTIAAALRQDIEAIAQKAASEAATLAIQKFRESQAVDVPIAKLIELLRARPDALEIALRSAEAYVAGQSVASEAKPKDQSG